MQYIYGICNMDLTDEAKYSTMWDGQSSIHGKTIRVSTIQNLPLSGLVNEEGHFHGVGVAFELLRILERDLNFTHVVINPQNSQEDPLNVLNRREVDMVVGFLPILSQLQPSVSYSTGLSQDHWVILMRRPEESASGTGLLAPFDTSVWLLTLASLLIMGPVIYTLLILRAWLCPSLTVRHHPSYPPTQPVFPLSSCIWFAYSAIMKQGSTLSPSNDLSRLLFATWWVFITILTSFYTANLTAFLTLSRYTLAIEDAHDLASLSLAWVGQKGGALEHAIMKTDELGFLRRSIFAGFGRFLDLADDDVLKLVLSGHVYLGERRAVERMVFRNYLSKARQGLDHSGRCTYVFTPRSFMVRSLAFAFPENSSLQMIFDPILRALVEGGVVRHSLQLELPSSDICPLKLGNSERQLRNADLFATYVAVVVGFVSALTAFLMELLLRRVRWCRSKTQIQPISKGNAKNSTALLKTSKVAWSEVVLYPQDFTFALPKDKAVLLLDPHRFLVQRTLLQGSIHKPFKRVAFTK